MKFSLPLVIASIIAISAYMHIYPCGTCLDNSRHMAANCDSKEYELIECNCPCWQYKIFPNRNQCARCLHYHDETPIKPKLSKKPAQISHKDDESSTSRDTEKAVIRIRN